MAEILPRKGDMELTHKHVPLWPYQNTDKTKFGQKNSLKIRKMGSTFLFENMRILCKI